MLLAGGQGSRLHVLTRKTAKPAVPFGGKYRIIDFPLSNCANSGIDVVGVLTQYESVLLNSYVAAGRRWGLDAKDSGVFVLPPREKADADLDVYRGTADAISQNIDFIDTYNPEYVLILSGDHIYKMNYDKMLEDHKARNADATIAVLEVPMKEASRFGIMSVNDDGSVWKFSEKPKNPDSTKASMGIYIFNTKKLLSYLEEDEKNPDSENDFGKNIIPAMLGAGERMFAYPFSGYWKDVGTIKSLWEANMDMLGADPALVLNDDKWRIYARHYAQAPQFISKDAEISNCSITEGCEIYGKVKNSVLGVGVRVLEGAEVVDSVIMSGATIDKNAVVKYSIVDSFAYVGEGATLGADRAEGVEVAVVGAGVNVAAGENVPQGAMLYGEW